MLLHQHANETAPISNNNATNPPPAAPNIHAGGDSGGALLFGFDRLAVVAVAAIVIAGHILPVRTTVKVLNSCDGHVNA